MWVDGVHKCVEDVVWHAYVYDWMLCRCVQMWGVHACVRGSACDVYVYPNILITEDYYNMIPQNQALGPKKKKKRKKFQW